MPITPLNTLALVNDAPVIPVIVLDDAAHAVPLAQALLAGGIRVLEVTLRTPAALAAITLIAEQVPDAIIGAGSVCNAEDAKRVKDAGAQFAVSPGFTASLAQACKALDLPLLPGVASASEIMQAREHDLRVLKFFPAQASGGTTMLKAWAGPFKDVLFCPTGGIQPDNAKDYLSLSNVRCVGGSWLVPPAALQQQDWAKITELARQAAALG